MTSLYLRTGRIVPFEPLGDMKLASPVVRSREMDCFQRTGELLDPARIIPPEGRGKGWRALKWSEEDFGDMGHLYDDGLPIEMIAARYECSKSYVNHHRARL